MIKAPGGGAAAKENPAKAHRVSLVVKMIAQIAFSKQNCLPKPKGMQMRDRVVLERAISCETIRRNRGVQNGVLDELS